MARGYLTYEENGETKEYYTAQTKAYSLTDVALSAPDSVKEQVKSYIVEKATVTFKDGETQLAQTEFNYGDKITYPATSVGADRYVEWKTSKNTTWNTDWTAQQSLTLTANYVDCFGYKVEDCLYNHDENGGNSGFTKSATAVPVGFENVYEKTSDFYTSTYPDGYLHGRMSHASISKYSEVRFAIKSSAYFVIDKDGYTGSSDKESFDGWLLFKLTRKADGIWHINISHNGVVVRDFDDIEVRTDAKGDNHICSILWHNRAGGITPVGNENGLTVYCTEIRAEFDDHFNVSGEVITDTLFEDNKNGSTMQNVTAANVKMPYGFKKVWQHKMSKTDIHGGLFSGKVLSAYKEVRLALKSNAGIKCGTFNPWEITNHGGEGVWTYVTLARNVNENVDALVKNFCGAYYGTGGEYIYSLLTSEQARYKKVSDLSTSANNGEDAVGIHVIREGVAVKSYRDEKEFDTWYGYIKSAVTAIENSGATEEAKTEYKKRIMREGIAVRYMKYYVFNSFVTLASGETDSISAMISDAGSVNITRFAERQAYVWNESRSGWRQVDGRIDKPA